MTETIYTQEPGKYHVQKTVGGYVVVFVQDRHNARNVDGGRVHKNRQNAYAKAKRLNQGLPQQGKIEEQFEHYWDDDQENTLVIKGITTAQQILDICAEHGDSGQHDFDMSGDLTRLPSNYIGKATCDDGIRIEFYAVDGETSVKIVEDMF